MNASHLLRKTSLPNGLIYDKRDGLAIWSGVAGLDANKERGSSMRTLRLVHDEPFTICVSAHGGRLWIGVPSVEARVLQQNVGVSPPDNKRRGAEQLNLKLRCGIPISAAL